MVEYGHGISEGAGSVAGSQGGRAGVNDDWGGQIVGMATDAMDQVTALPPAQLLLLVAIVVIGFFILKRAF